MVVCEQHRSDCVHRQARSVTTRSSTAQHVVEPQILVLSAPTDTQNVAWDAAADEGAGVWADGSRFFSDVLCGG